jgi:hypothetical protein
MIVKPGDILIGRYSGRVLLFLRVEPKQVFFVVLDGDKVVYRTLPINDAPRDSWFYWEELGWRMID